MQGGVQVGGWVGGAMQSARSPITREAELLHLAPWLSKGCPPALFWWREAQQASFGSVLGAGLQLMAKAEQPTPNRITLVQSQQAFLPHLCGGVERRRRRLAVLGGPRGDAGAQGRQANHLRAPGHQGRHDTFGAGRGRELAGGAPLQAPQRAVTPDGSAPSCCAHRLASMSRMPMLVLGQVRLPVSSQRRRLVRQ